MLTVLVLGALGVGVYNAILLQRILRQPLPEPINVSVAMPAPPIPVPPPAPVVTIPAALAAAAARRGVSVEVLEGALKGLIQHPEERV